MTIASAAVVVVTAAQAQADDPLARAADRDCSDFATQRAAQSYFLDRGGPGSDPDRLDGDGDGRACDSLPCPCGTGGHDPSPRPAPKPPRRPDFPARIVRVTDGDTVVVRSSSGRRFKTRLIGVDTPEVFGGLECGGRAASASMKRLAPPGRRVRVKGDPTQDRRDSFGRLLAYVKTRGGPQLNIAQVRRGWAKVFVFQGNPFRQTETFRRAARSAKRARRGVWGRCGGDFHRRVQSSTASDRRAAAAACPNSIRLGGRAYVFYRLRVRCALARRSVRRLYSSRGRRGRLRGFICESGSGWRTGGGVSHAGVSPGLRLASGRLSVAAEAARQNAASARSRWPPERWLGEPATIVGASTRSNQLAAAPKDAREAPLLGDQGSEVSAAASPSAQAAA